MKHVNVVAVVVVVVTVVVVVVGWEILLHNISKKQKKMEMLALANEECKIENKPLTEYHRYHQSQSFLNTNN